MAKCGGKTRKGTMCEQPAGWGTDHVGEGRCKLHAGSTPRGADSPHFIHGGYSKFAQKGIADKVAAFQDADPFDLTHELALTRGLLAEFVSRLETPVAEDSLDTASMLADRIRKIVASISQIKNDSALTAAEITYLAMRATEVVVRYIDDPDKQKAFVQDLFGGLTGAPATIPGRVTHEEDER